MSFPPMASRAEVARTDTWLLSLTLLPTRCKSTSSKPPLQPASHLLQLFLQPGKGCGQSGHLSPAQTSLPAQLAPLRTDPATGPTGSSEGVQPPTLPRRLYRRAGSPSPAAAPGTSPPDALPRLTGILQPTPRVVARSSSRRPERPGGQGAAPGDLVVKRELRCFGTKFGFQGQPLWRRARALPLRLGGDGIKEVT